MERAARQIFSGEDIQEACLANLVNLNEKGTYLKSAGYDYKKLQGMVRTLKRRAARDAPPPSTSLTTKAPPVAPLPSTSLSYEERMRQTAWQVAAGEKYEEACLANLVNLNEKGKYRGIKGPVYYKLKNMVRDFKSAQRRIKLQELQQIVPERDELKQLVSIPVTCISN